MVFVGLLILFFNLVVFLIYMKSFLDIRRFVYSLPTYTKSKYIGLVKLARTILLASFILIGVSIMAPITLMRILASATSIFLVVYAFSELEDIKKYTKKKKG